MSHTILKKTFISKCGREDASCQSLAGEGDGQRAQAADAKGLRTCPENIQLLPKGD